MRNHFLLFLSVFIGCCSMSFAKQPDAIMDVRADIPQPEFTETLDPGIDDNQASGRVRVYRAIGERKGIIIQVAGFGENDPLEESNTMPRAFRKNGPGDEDDTGSADDPDFEFAREELGYDIYTLSWYEGTTYIQKNAMVLVKLLELIYAGEVTDNESDPAVFEQALQEDEKLVILAPSMGGLVSRYALLYMEDRASLGQGINHGVDLWITMDTPHLGAYIPIGIQYLANYLNSVTLGFKAEDQLREINSPAAKQLLLFHHTATSDPSNDSKTHNDLRDIFLGELEAYGDYPQAEGLRKVAFANGRGDGQYAHFVNENEDLGIEGGDRVLGTETGRIRIFQKKFVLSSTENDLAFEKFGIKVDIPSRYEVGVILEAWSTSSEDTNDLVFRSEVGVFLYMDGGRVDLGVEAIKDVIRNTFVPKLVPDYVVERTVNREANTFLDLVLRQSAVLLPDSGSARITTDYAYEWLPGGLGKRHKEAAEAINGNFTWDWHSYIPAVSAVGYDGPLDTPLEAISAENTPFDRIGYQEENSSHVKYGSNKNKDAYALFREEITALLETPTSFSTRPAITPEGSAIRFIIVNGQNFTEETQAFWNGSPRTTTFISEEELRIAMNENDTNEVQEALITFSDPVSDFSSFIGQQFDVVPVDVNVTPSNFGPGDLVRFEYDGLSTDGNLPRDPVATRTGNTIRVVATKPNRIVPQVFSPYELELSLGRLDPGQYTLIYSVDGPFGLDERERRQLDLRIAPTSIDSIKPESFKTAGVPLTIELTGSGFFATPNVPEAFRTRAYWNGVEVPAEAFNREFIEVEVPGDAPTATVNILEIVNPEPGGGSAIVEVVYTGPLVFSAERSFVKSDEGLSQRITIEGENLEPPLKVLWNGEETDYSPRPDGSVWLNLTPDQTASQGLGTIVLEDAEGNTAPVFRVAQIPPPNVLLVKTGTAGGDDGETWETAFDRLDSALAVASAEQEIWVASGTYESPFFGPNTGFEMVEGVAILGGFEGGETANNQRNPDPATNGTILTGDRLGDDGNFGLGGDNAKHVIQGTDLTEATILDGFTIQGGNGSMELIADNNQGGGIKLINSSSILRNLIIEGNKAALGGGLYSIGGSPSLENLTLQGNQGTFGGGALFLGGAAILDRLCVFGNEAFEGGGLRFESNSTATLSNSLLIGNVATNGGGLQVTGSSPSLSFVTISGNEASASGGGISNSGTTPLLNNTIIWGNTALLGEGIAGVPIDPASSDNTIEGGHPAGTNTNESDPLFINLPSPGEDKLWYPDSGDNYKGNLRLLAHSPANGQGAYEGVFSSFAELYPDLEETADANRDGISNFLAYLVGQDPEAPSSQAMFNQIDRTSDGVYFDISVRSDDGAFEFQNQLSTDLVTWYPLDDTIGLDLEVETSEVLPNGLTRIRGHLLIEPNLPGSLFVRTEATPREDTDGLRNNP